MRTALTILPVLLIVFSCGQEQSNQQHKNNVAIDKKKLDQQIINANRQLSKKESDEMDVYAVNHHMAFVQTKTGIRYYVYKPSLKGDSIRDGMMVSMNYTLSLLDGTVCYSSDKDGKRTFEVGHEDIESGIHRGLTYLKKGDKAILLIPSFMAHGLLGDLNKIPPMSPIVYHVEIDQ